jgi:hypothetical protein
MTLKALAKKLLPLPVRILIIKYLGKINMYCVKIKVIKYLNKNKKNAEEIVEILEFLKHNSFSTFPYNYTKKYKSSDVIVYSDNNCNMKYVLQDSKRMYFKKSWSEKMIQKYYNSLSMEQDIDSPHRYEYDDFHVDEGDIVVDVGVAEGNFSLSIVDKVEKLYLFETDKEWIEVLKKTFGPWQEKVVFINKYVSDRTDNDCISLDDYFNEQKIDFLKVDIEGAETQLLEGIKKTLLAQKLLKIVICTYHKNDDADDIDKILTNAGFYIRYSKGYMIFPENNVYIPPYLRRGLIRGSLKASLVKGKEK